MSYRGFSIDYAAPESPKPGAKLERRAWLIRAATGSIRSVFYRTKTLTAAQEYVNKLIAYLNEV